MAETLRGLHDNVEWTVFGRMSTNEGDYILGDGGSTEYGVEAFKSVPERVLKCGSGTARDVW
jgi:hypothetical protein